MTVKPTRELVVNIEQLPTRHPIGTYSEERLLRLVLEIILGQQKCAHFAPVETSLRCGLIYSVVNPDAFSPLPEPLSAAEIADALMSMKAAEIGYELLDPQNSLRSWEILCTRFGGKPAIIALADSVPR